jgi:3-hydroxyacyl-CoA dehydrogenase
MGAGIVEVSARVGYDVVVLEVNQALLDRGLARIGARWKRRWPG